MRQKISAYPASETTPSWIRAPPESLIPTTGQPTLTAMSITLQIFSANTSLSEPPKTVKSCEKTNTGRPNTVPYPVTTASPQGRLSRIPNSTSRWRTKRSSSTNDPGSSSRSTRSRASSLPRACCFATAFSPAASAASALSSASQRASPRWCRASPRELSCRRHPRVSLSRPAGHAGRATASRCRAHRHPPIESCRDHASSTARPPGPTTRPASRARSPTPATPIRTPSPSRGRSGQLDGGRALLFPAGMGAVTGVVLTMLPPGRDDRGRRGLLLRPLAAVRPPPPVGRQRGRVRPDRAAARRRRPDPDRGAVEPDADDAGLRGRRRAPGPGRLRCDARLAAPRAPARARLRRRAPQRHEGARRARRPDRGRRHA